MLPDINNLRFPYKRKLFMEVQRSARDCENDKSVKTDLSLETWLQPGNAGV